MGLLNFVPLAKLHVQGQNFAGDASTDIIKAEIYDTGSSNSRNLVLGNVDSTTTRFAVIAFTPSSSNSKSGAEINGVQRSVANFSSGLAFSTRNDSTGEALKERMRISANGSVGINTTAPRELLDVFGNIRAGGWGKGSVSIGPDHNFPKYPTITFNVSQTSNDSVNVASKIPDSYIFATSKSLNYITKAYTAYHFFGGGNVAMAHADFFPTARLHVAGSRVGNGEESIDLFKAELNVCGSDCGLPDLSRNIVLTNQYPTSSKFAIIAFAPNSLDSKSGAEINGVERSVANSSAGLSFSTRANTANATLNERMRISANGNVGIGTTAPSQALDVIGNIKATGSNGGSAMLASTDNSTRTGNVGFYAPNGTRLGYIGNADTSSIRYISEQNRDHFFGGGNVAMGGVSQSGVVGEGFKALARLHVAAGYYGGSTIDIAKFEINNCGESCSQETARNIVLTNQNYTNSKFATIVFAPSAGDTQSGAEIAGVERSPINFSCGLSFSTRRAELGSPLTERLRIKENGNIGFGLSNPTAPLHMASGAYASAAGVWVNASDARLKTNIVPTTYGLKEVMALRPVHYNMKKGGEAQVGFIAQEVRKVVPEVVSGIEGDLLKGETLGLSYGNLVPVLTKAIQEQQAQIEALKAEKVAYKALMKEMRAEMRAEIKAEVQAEITSMKEQFGIKSEENQKAKK